MCLLLVSCSKEKPESVVLKFYDAVLKENLQGAKDLCLPSASEEMDRLNSIEALKKNVNRDPMKIMEVVIKNPSPKDGDTAVVNYEIKDYKNFITLILKDKKWMIAKTDELKQLPVLEFESSEFWDTFIKKPSVFGEKYLGMVFNIKNLVGLNYGNEGYPYVRDKKLIYANQIKNIDKFSTKTVFKVFGKDVELNSNIELREYVGGAGDVLRKVIFVLEDLSAADGSTLTDPEITKLDMTNSNHMEEIYNFKNIVDFRGEFSEYDASGVLKMIFNKSKITNIQKQ